MKNDLEDYENGFPWARGDVIIRKYWVRELYGFSAWGRKEKRDSGAWFGNEGEALREKVSAAFLQILDFIMKILHHKP